MTDIIREFEDLCETASDAPDVFAYVADRDPTASDVLQLVLVEQHFRWRTRAERPVADYIEKLPQLAAEEKQFELLAEEFGYWEQHHPGGITAFLAKVTVSDALRQRLLDEFQTEETDAVTRTDSFADQQAPERIGRYTVEKEIGRGSYGRVFLARDAELARSVAIKVPNRKYISDAGGADAFLAEARIAASVDAVGIVPVFDTGATEDGLCYVVSRYISGGTLAERMQSPFTVDQAVSMTAQIARAMHAAHRAKVVHRDLKPANILLDDDGAPWITDFGLALVERDVRTGRGLVGTPAWMSPEQARGEGHRVDPRSDIYSLGVILYEMLTGQRPISAPSSTELLRRIGSEEVRPPRQIVESIPRELDHICLKALAQRLSDRYSTSLDFAEDLELFAAGKLSTDSNGGEASVTPTKDGQVGSGSGSDTRSSVIPRGLRSFGAEDAGFFLSLVPGPRGPLGLPDMVRFWKSRIESKHPDNTFPVGLLYGPSGSGKSSLLKAGIVPLLADNIRVVFVEASRDGTEKRIAERIAGESDRASNLVEAMQQLRREPSTQKTLLVIDQFEQWLQGWETRPNSTLADALRQCDGVNLQCVLLVRDDFWMAITRFMRELDVSLVERGNSSGIDLFDKKHARNVLRAFGRAYGALPAYPAELKRPQEDFIAQSVDLLADQGYVIPVQLALFAEMVKAREWEPRTLEVLGGLQGVGVQFLDEAFGPAAPPLCRLHAVAAREALKSLLPETGGTIKGKARTATELRSAAEYDNQPRAFDELLQVLDQELRLITLVDSPGERGDDSLRSYQLAHDYLVPSLREWLTRQQQTTRRGRAELGLRERAADWNTKPEPRRLPSIAEFARFAALTRKSRWTPDESRMMSTALRFHLFTSIAVLGVVCMVAAGVYMFVIRSKARALRDQLLAARPSEVPAILEEMQPYRRWVDPLLLTSQTNGESETSGSLTRRTLVNLALLDSNPDRANELIEPLVRSDFPSFELIVNQVNRTGSGNQISDTLWTRLHDEGQSIEDRLRAASALAKLAPDDARWDEAGSEITSLLINTKSSRLGEFIAALRPKADVLQSALTRLFKSDEPRERDLATELLAEFGNVDIVELSPNASPEQLSVLVQQSDGFMTDDAREKIRARYRELLESDRNIASNRSFANVLAFMMAEGEVNDIAQFLVASENNTLRSQIIKRCGHGGARPEQVLPLLDSSDLSVCRAAILMLGEIPNKRFPRSAKLAATDRLLTMFENHPDPGVHSAADWTLRRWDKQLELKAIESRLATGTFEGDRRWYITTLGHTLARVDPKPFRFGARREHKYVLSKEVYDEELDELAGSYVIATKELTDAQYREFYRQNRVAISERRFNTEADVGPALQMSWIDAAHYCNWLSEQEGIPEDQWCYEPNTNGLYKAGMKIKAGNDKRTGYQIPAPGYWQYACESGSTTSRYFGNDEQLNDDYAWTIEADASTAHEVGVLKPNDFGLFDMLGNAAEWTNHNCYGTPRYQIHNKELIIDRERFTILGGSFRQISRFHRSASFSLRFPVDQRTLATTLRVMRMIVEEE